MQLSQDPLLEKIRSGFHQLQQNAPQLYGWKIMLEYSQSLQSLLLGDANSGFRVYQEREVNDLSYRIEVYARYGNPQKMGVSSRTIDPLSPLSSQIASAFQNAQLVENPVWNLASPSNTPYPQIETADPAIVKDIITEHHKLLTSACAKAQTVNGVKINSGELYTNLHTEYFETSTGIQGEQQSTDVYFEIALEKLPIPNDQEVLKYKKAISVEEANLGAFIQETVEETLSIEKAQMPETESDVVVLVDGHTISDFFHTLVSQLNAENEYRKSPHFLPGDCVHNGEKIQNSDRLKMTLDPTLPVMAESTPYTSEGLPACKAVVIDNDIVQDQLIDTRMGDYLHKKANGIVGNIVLEPGTLTKTELIESVPKCLEVVSFSSLLLNPNTLTWSSEIKLARLHQTGTPPCIIKGGVMSGSLKENLRHFHFSKNQVKHNAVAEVFEPAKGYWGPDAMLIHKGVKLAGV